MGLVLRVFAVWCGHCQSSFCLLAAVSLHQSQIHWWQVVGCNLQGVSILISVMFGVGSLGGITGITGGMTVYLDFSYVCFMACWPAYCLGLW